MKPSTEKYLIYALSSIIYGALMLISPDVVNNVTIFYVSIVSAFLGIDLATSLKQTNSLPEGEFKPLKKDRYFVTGLVTTLLLTASVVMTKVYNIDLTGATATLSSALFIVMGLFIAGLESTKLLTGTKPTETNKETLNG